MLLPDRDTVEIATATTCYLQSDEGTVLSSDELANAAEELHSGAGTEWT